ncbi:MAG: DNA polymerase III subunit delta' [Bacteroidales bacterium]|nr:DNA polymerase III subunit delta' [Bacteroidales bacterium]
MRFGEIIGQQEIQIKLMRSAQSGRVSHAQLFFGPEGSGALALALAYAQYLHCSEPVTDSISGLPDSCGHCSSCMKYSKLIHPDLHFIFPVAATPQVPKNPVSRSFYEKWREFLLATRGYGNLIDWYNHIGIDRKQGLINAEDCSEILRTLSYKSYQGGYKIMIIWMVEKLFHAAAPKILKVLEEPPDQTLFILVTESPDQIIRTIQSRTQFVKILPISDPDLGDALRRLGGIESGNIPDIVRMAQGNYREALRLANQENPDMELFERFKLWMRACFQNKAPELLDVVRETSSLGREAQKHFLIYALKIVRESLLLDIRGDSLSRLTKAELDFVRNFSPFVHLKNGESIVLAMEEAFQEIERNANPNILFTSLSLRLAALLRLKAG